MAMESPGLATAESKNRKPAKVLSHLSVSRSLDGGHVVEHHYTTDQHDPRIYKFGASDKARAREHVLRHAGLSESGAANSAAVIEDEE
jgi:hypothetical protein